MTYNFDPDEWLARERRALEARFAAGELTPAQLNEAMEELERRQQEMWGRLDGSYRLPG